MTVWQLNVDLHYYWHAGSGSSSGTHLDALCERDGAGLPFLAGRHLKGLLRHALQRAEQWHWLSESLLPQGPMDDWESLLFGTRSQTAQRFQTFPGLLVIDDAVLPVTERAWFECNPADKPLIFEELYSTAINAKGCASAQSLRGMEVALPMALEASVTCELTALDKEHRQQQRAVIETVDISSLIARILPLIDAVGAHRSRGLGEASLRLQLPKGGRS